MLETEDLAEQENKELASRLESLESIVRMLELKHKNSLEHASRLEEREGDLKKVKSTFRISFKSIKQSPKSDNLKLSICLQIVYHSIILTL